MSERLFKVLDEDGSPCNGGRGLWPLPQGDEPGEWLTVEGNLMPCQHGLHLCRERDLVRWLGPAIYAVEYRGERIDEHDKIVVREARLLRRYETWTDRTARHFAADCAERVLPLFEGRCPHDDRPRIAVKAARAFADGSITADELRAARAAARAAAWEAARAAAWEAGREAAREAAGAAGRKAERAWQTERLLACLDGEITLPPLTKKGDAS